MPFWKKTPKRLYYPVKSSWYTRPRRKPSVKRQTKFFKGGFSWLKKLAKKSLYIVIATGVLALLIIFFAFSSYFSIKKIEVIRQTFNVDSASIENQLNKYIGKNIIFFSRSNIYKTIQDKFPEFANVKVHKILPSTISIELESQPIIANLKAYYILPEPEPVTDESYTELNKAIEELAGTDPNLNKPSIENPLADKKVTETAFTLDENRKPPEPIEQKCLLNQVGQAIFDQEENLELMTISIRGLTQPIVDREQVIPTDHMEYMLGALQYYKNVMGLDILGIEYLPIEREMHLKTANNLFLWISLERDYKEQIDKLHTIYEAAELNKEDLAYIDLRIKEKVIYCPRNSSCDK